MNRIQFRLSTLVLFTGTIAIGLGWWIDHQRLRRELEQRGASIIFEALAVAAETKQHQWRVSDHLQSGTTQLENLLAAHVASPQGKMVTSEGWGGPFQLRIPTYQSIERILPLLEHKDPVVRQRAAELVALYGEAFSLYALYSGDDQSYELLKLKAPPRLIPLLDDSSSSIRRASALAIGQVGSRDQAADAVLRAYSKDKNLYLAWAIQRIVR
jgi:hypothetical protein